MYDPSVTTVSSIPFETSRPIGPSAARSSSNDGGGVCDSSYCFDGTIVCAAFLLLRKTPTHLIVLSSLSSSRLDDNIDDERFDILRRACNVGFVVDDDKV